MKRLECLSLLGPLIKDDDLVVTTLGWVPGAGACRNGFRLVGRADGDEARILGKQFLRVVNLVIRQVGDEVDARFFEGVVNDLGIDLLHVLFPQLP